MFKTLTFFATINKVRFAFADYVTLIRLPLSLIGSVDIGNAELPVPCFLNDSQDHCMRSL